MVEEDLPSVAEVVVVAVDHQKTLEAAAEEEVHYHSSLEVVEAVLFDLH
jgi:hypothetical protein